MIYKVKNATPKTTSTGKAMKALELVDSNGTEHKVNIFSDFPNYAGISAGSEIDGELKQNDKGYTNLYSNLVPEKKPNNFKQVMVEKTMERKEQSIGKFQDNKEFSIKVASTFSNAVNLAIANFKQNPTSLRTLEEEVEYWREWCWTHYDVDPTRYVPF